MQNFAAVQTCTSLAIIIIFLIFVNSMVYGTRNPPLVSDQRSLIHHVKQVVYTSQDIDNGSHAAGKYICHSFSKYCTCTHGSIISNVTTTFYIRFIAETFRLISRTL